MQASHAALEAGFSFNKPDSSTHLVLLSAKDEDHLKNIAKYLEDKHIQFEMFYEPDYNTGFASICTEPLFGDDRKPLRKFSLFKSK